MVCINIMLLLYLLISVLISVSIIIKINKIDKYVLMNVIVNINIYYKKRILFNVLLVVFNHYLILLLKMKNVHQHVPITLIKIINNNII